eukprot:617661-Rhodomonas_salina.2
MYKRGLRALVAAYSTSVPDSGVSGTAEAGVSPTVGAYQYSTQQPTAIAGTTDPERTTFSARSGDPSPRYPRAFAHADFASSEVQNAPQQYQPRCSSWTNGRIRGARRSRQCSTLGGREKGWFWLLRTLLGDPERTWYSQISTGVRRYGGGGVTWLRVRGEKEEELTDVGRLGVFSLACRSDVYYQRCCLVPQDTLGQYRTSRSMIRQVSTGNRVVRYARSVPGRGLRQYRARARSVPGIAQEARRRIA